MKMRPLASTDYKRGHLSLLTILTSAPDIGELAYTTQFNIMKSTPNTYYTIVIVNKPTDTIVAIGGVFMERKFLRNLGIVGHIEDIAVDKKVQRAKLGLRTIQALTGISEAQGAYKTILNCSTDNIRTFSLSLQFVKLSAEGYTPLQLFLAFYQKCGYVQKEHEMAKYATDTGINQISKL